MALSRSTLEEVGGFWNVGTLEGCYVGEGGHLGMSLGIVGW